MTGFNGEIALVIMAAGIGSRFGGGIKQLAPVGANGEIIMDYSIHDAIAAGFRRIVFIIRRDIEQEFREVIGNRIEMLCASLGVTVGYAYQSMEDLPEGYTVPEGRKKPWGTAQAVLTCRNAVDGPFAVINADDYYGKEAYRQLYRFLREHARGMTLCMAGFTLENTLSEYGGVTRGLCRAEETGWLTDVTETGSIVKTPEGASADGKALDPKLPVSMNMWGLTPEFFSCLEEGFRVFLAEQSGSLLTEEYLLPVLIGGLLREGKVRVRLLETGDKWFGVTYREDRQTVADAIRGMTEAGQYAENLFSDLLPTD